MSMSHTTGDVAKRLDVTTATIRKWVQVYEGYLSDKVVNKRANAAHKFNDNDLVIFATVADGREKGFTHDQIKGLLDQGTRADEIPELPSEDEIEARQAIELVPIAERDNALQLAERLQSELNRSIERWQDDTSKLQGEINRLERELGTAQGKLEHLERERTDFDRRRIEVNRLWIALIAVAIAAAIVLAVVVTILLQSP